MIENVTSVVASEQLASANNTTSLQAGYNVSLGDLSAFETALSSASGQLQVQKSELEAPTESALMVAKPLEFINREAAEISKFATDAAASGDEFTPGEMIMLTVRSQEFMFHCQLTSNIANRTSDGLQQLFRQQS